MLRIPFWAISAALPLTLEVDSFVRGATGTVYFTLENSSSEDAEVVTANVAGSSSDVEFTLADLEGNILSAAPFVQALGDPLLVGVANGETVARIPAGKTFSSKASSLNVPLGAPRTLRLSMRIANLYHHRGQPDEVKLDGRSGGKDVSLVETSYRGELSSATPAVSNGKEGVTIAGRAVSSADGLPLPNAKLNLLVLVNGFKRIFEVLTGADGTFSYLFQPLPEEYGEYTAKIAHPDLTTVPYDDIAFVVEFGKCPVPGGRVPLFTGFQVENHGCQAIMDI